MHDAGQPGPSTAPGTMSLQGLEASLPVVRSRAEGLALFHKRKQDYEATVAAEERAKKSRQGSMASFVGQPVVSAAPVPIVATREVDRFNCRNIINPDRRIPCAFKFEDADGDSTAVIGDLWSMKRIGWSVWAEIDAGRYGAPHVSLIFRVNKGNKRAAVTTQLGGYYEFDITWRAGIQVDDQLVVEDLRVHEVISYVDSGEPPYDSGIFDSCPREQDHKLQKLAAITMKCNSARVSTIEDAWLEGLDDTIKNGIKAMFHGIGTHEMTIWFLAYPNMDATYDRWAAELVNFVEDRKSAFWQYKTPENVPNFDIDENQPINTFNKAMYVKYRTQKDKDDQLHEDKNTIVGFHQFAKQLSWEVPFEFAAYNAIPVIRGAQFQKGQVAHLQFQPHPVHFQKMPRIDVTGVEGGCVGKELFGAYKCFFRKATPGAVPPPGSKINGQFDNSNRRTGKPHQMSEDRKDIWWGTVMKDMEGQCRDNGTDFCVWMTTPYGARAPRSYPKADGKIPDHQFTPMHIAVKMDFTSAKREIEGMVKLAEDESNAGGLGPARMALMSAPSQLTHLTRDLTAKNPGLWQKWEEHIRPNYLDNPAQWEIVTSLKKVKNALTAVVGPPGTGKTSVLADIVNGAVMCGHKVLVCAVSNNAVDKAANSCWQKFPPNHRKTKKFLRYETASAELQALLTRKDVGASSAQDSDARPTYKPAVNIEDDDLISQTLADAAYLHDEHQHVLKKLMGQEKSYSEAMAEKAKLDERKRSNVAAAMTLPDRCHQLTSADEYKADADFDAEIAAYRADKLEADEIEVRAAAGGYRTQAEVSASHQDPMPEEEIKKRLEDGRIPSKEQRDPSFEYKDTRHV